MFFTDCVSGEALFITQVCFSGAAFIFSVAMLATGSPASIYLPVLTGTIGYWTPNPVQAKYNTGIPGPIGPVGAQGPIGPAGATGPSGLIS